MKQRLTRLLVMLAVLVSVGGALARGANTITIAPASLSLKGASGQMYTQNFKVTNLMDSIYVFRIDVSDVYVEAGRRKFVPAGQSPLSLAALVTASRTEVKLAPGEEAVVPVTFIMPSETRIRAVAVFFRGVPDQLAVGQRRILLNLGAVVDFSLTNEVVLDSLSLGISPQTATTNTTVRQELANVGPEPTIVRGVSAFLDQSGRLLGKAAFGQKRLLPGEHNVLQAEFAGTLPAGKYRVVSSLEYSGETLTRTAELVIP
jgi:hypothetical protein